MIFKSDLNKILEGLGVGVVGLVLLLDVDCILREFFFILLVLRLHEQLLEQGRFVVDCGCTLRVANLSLLHGLWSIIYFYFLRLQMQLKYASVLLKISKNYIAFTILQIILSSILLTYVH